MKNMKKILALVLALMLVLGMTAAGAQTVDSGKGGTGSITISNAAKGETYSAYMLFEATLGGDGKIAYKGTVPAGLGDYFEETSTNSGYVQAKAAAFKNVTYYTDAEKTTTSETATAYWTAAAGSEMSDDLKTALTSWKNGKTPAATAVSDGSALTFSNLVLGYYVVTTSQGEQAISVDSTMPSVNIVDKNTTRPGIEKLVNGKKLDDISIGDTVTYTVTATTTNWITEEGKDPEQVKSYTIEDTLPEFMTDVTVTGLKVVQSTDDKTTYPDVDLFTPGTNGAKGTPQFDSNKKILIEWVDENNSSLYKNGSTIELTYTAVITSTVMINVANKNTVTLTPYHDKEGRNPFQEDYDDHAEIKTYGAALKKVDGNDQPLAGAEFKLTGVTVEPVDATNQPGLYRVTSAGTGLETGNLTTNDQGELYIIGLDSDESLTVTEMKAPDGYNKLTETKTLTPETTLTTEIYEMNGTRYYDADGNLVAQSENATTTKTDLTANYKTVLHPELLKIVNQAGVELPSTGGIGTTLFYIGGGILVLAAVILLVTKRRMNAND